MNFYPKDSCCCVGSADGDNVRRRPVKARYGAERWRQKSCWGSGAGLNLSAGLIQTLVLTVNSKCLGHPGN